MCCRPASMKRSSNARGSDTINPDLASGDWVMRCEERTLDDIRALGGNDPADDRCFAAAAKFSEINLALYRAFAQPFVRALANPPMAEMMQKLHPLRITYELFSDENPMMAMLKPMASWVREHRSAAPPDNPFIGWQENISKQIIARAGHLARRARPFRGTDVLHHLRLRPRCRRLSGSIRQARNACADLPRILGIRNCCARGSPN